MDMLPLSAAACVVRGELLNDHYKRRRNNEVNREPNRERESDATMHRGSTLAVCASATNRERVCLGGFTLKQQRATACLRGTGGVGEIRKMRNLTACFSLPLRGRLLIFS